MILSRNMLKRMGESRHPCRTSTVVRISYTAVKGDCTGGPIIEMFDGSDKVGADSKDSTDDGIIDKVETSLE